MKAVISPRAGLASLGLVVAIGMTIALTRVTASSSDVLEACINPGNGMMRLVAADTACHPKETRVTWNVEGPAGPSGPAGPQGPEGPAGGSAGPPFVWVCTPANLDIGNHNNGEIDVFNGSTATANVAAHFLAKDGTNLAGATIPGSSPAATYPGQTGSTTVAVAADHTLIIPYQIGAGIRASDNGLLASVRVTSDQPIVVGTAKSTGLMDGSGCSLLPK